MTRQDELGDVTQAFGQMFDWPDVRPGTLRNPRAQAGRGGSARFKEATILFADLVDFMGLAAASPPTEWLCLLNGIFSAFDILADQ